MESTSYVERPSFRPAQFSYPSNALGSSHGWREKPKCSCVVVVRRLDAFPSLPGIVPHRKKERRAPARPVVEELSLNWRTEVTFGTILPKANTCPVQRERAAQKNVSCYTESPAGHRGPSGARTTTPNVTHPSPTYRLGGTSESLTYGSFEKGVIPPPIRPDERSTGKDRKVPYRDNTLNGSSARWAYLFCATTGKDPADLPRARGRALFQREWGVNRKASVFLGRGKESKPMDINEPSLMDVAHDTINSTQGPALIEVAYSPIIVGGSHEIYAGRRNQMKGSKDHSIHEGA
ncbi:hypothetical protein V8G54_019916 [Vigna mungo]|uniref:Uncharacterized protein n=1 Tax=Vigna mungo TaxID=3915 RepID=A0AAQ3NAS2_VIGMU